MPRATKPGTEMTESGLWFYNWQIWRTAKPLLSATLEELGLDARDFWMLSLVQQSPIRQHELAVACGLDPSTLVALIDSLEQRGWLERKRDPSDRRAHLVSATALGVALFHRARPLAQRAEAEQMQALSPTEQRRLLQLLRKLVHARG